MTVAATAARMHQQLARVFSGWPLAQAAHPALKGSRELQLFLEASETEFAIEVSRSQVVDPEASQVR